MQNDLSRRQMIAAGLGTLGAVAANAETKPVNVGIIGVGLRSGAHLKALKALQSESKVVALSDLESARMEKAAGGLPSKPAMYTDYRELLKDKNVGAVTIVTPGYLHHEMAIAVLRAGKDLLLEKPLALNYKEASDIIREARKSNRIVCVGMQRRYSKGDSQIRKIVADGTIGPVKYINYEEYRSDWNANTSIVTNPKTGKKSSWRLQAWSSGSSELEFSIHALALVTSIVNSPVVRLSASGGVLHYKDGRDTRDVSSLLADFANGVRLNYAFTCFARAAGGKLLIVGDKGVIRRDGGKLLVSDSLDKPLAPVTVTGDDDGAEVQMYREFLQNVRTRTPNPLSAESALEPSKLAYGADISIRENRIVTSKDFPAI